MLVIQGLLYRNAYFLLKYVCIIVKKNLNNLHVLSMFALLYFIQLSVQFVQFIVKFWNSLCREHTWSDNGM